MSCYICGLLTCADIVQEYAAVVHVRMADPVCRSVPTLTGAAAETDLSATVVKSTTILVRRIRA